MEKRLVAVCAVALPLLMGFAHAQDIPITTKSEEARELFLKAVQANHDVQASAQREYASQAIEKDPQFAWAYLLRASSGEARDQLMADIGKAEEFKAKASPGEQLYIDLSIAQYKGESMEKQREMGDKLLAVYPNSEQALILCATVANDRGDREKALEYCTKLATLKPNMGFAFNALGYQKMSMGDLEGAEKAFQQYVALSPNIPNAHDSHAEVLFELGRHKESIQEYERALQIDPTFIMSIGSLGTNYDYQGDFARAREYYSQYFTKAKDNQNRWRAKRMTALSYLYQGQTEQAVQEMEALSKLYSEANDPGAVWRLGDASRILLESGQAKEAMPWVERAATAMETMKLDPIEKKRAARYVAYCRASALAATGKFDEAKAEAERFRQINETINDGQGTRVAHELMGIINSYEGNETAALEEFNQGDPNRPVLLYHKAVSLQKSGKTSEAQALFQKIAAMRHVDDYSLALVRPNAVKMAGPVQAGVGK